MQNIGFLADTNAVSDLLKGVDPVVNWFEAHKGQVAICTITLGELRRGIELTSQMKRRRELEEGITYFIESLSGAVWVFDESAAFEWGRMQAQARHRPLPYADSLIAAIASSMAVPVVTRNKADFPFSETLDPWTGILTPPQLYL